MAVERPIKVARDNLVAYLNHDSYLDLKKAVPVGKDEIRLEWADDVAHPTTIKVV